MIKATQRQCLVKSLLAGMAMAMMMTATAFATTTPPIRSGEYKAPTRAGYEFQGWYLNPECTGDMVIDKDGNWLVDIPENAEVFAKWKQPPTILLRGEDFNAKLGKLAGTTGKITAFKEANTAPDVSSITNANIVSTSDSAFPVYAWFDNGTIWWYSEADNVEMNPDCIYMFSSFDNISNLDLSAFDTSNVTTMYKMFYMSSITSINVNGWNTSNVTNMKEMFSWCRNLDNVDLSGFDTSNVTDMSSMFRACTNLTSLNVNGWNTSNVTNMKEMFSLCQNLDNVDLSGLDTSNVTDMLSMFEACTSLTSLDVSGWDTSKVTNMRRMFDGCSNLINLDIRGFDTAKVTSMTTMFSGCSSLTTLDLSGWDTTNLTSTYEMCRSCDNLTSIDLSGWNTSKVTNTKEMFYRCTNLTKIYASEGWDISAVSYFNSLNMFSDCEKLTNYDFRYTGKTRAYYGGDGKGYLTYKAAPTT